MHAYRFANMFLADYGCPRSHAHKQIHWRGFKNNNKSRMLAIAIILDVIRGRRVDENCDSEFVAVAILRC